MHRRINKTKAANFFKIQCGNRKMFLRTPFQKISIANKLTFETGDGLLLGLDVILSEQERASSCQISIYDPGLQYLNLFLTQFIAQGGILVPLGLLEAENTVGAGVEVALGGGSAPSTLADVEKQYGASDLTGLTAQGKQALTDLGNKNVVAFLNAIAVAELGETAAAKGGYGLLFGDSGTETFSISDLAKGHPGRARTSGGYTSTATGRFQILDIVYKEEQSKLGLKDFKPISQWLIAADRLTYRGVMDEVKAGSFEKAVIGDGGSKSAKGEWASLGSYGQGTQAGKLQNFLANVNKFLGSSTTTATTNTTGIPSNADILKSIAPSTTSSAGSGIDVSQGVIIMIEEGFNDETPSVQTQFILTDVKGSNDVPHITKISGKQVRYVLAKGSKTFKTHRNTSLRQLATAIASKIGASVELPDIEGVDKINAAITQQESDYQLLLKLAKKEGLLVRGTSTSLKLEPLTANDKKIVISRDILLSGSNWGESAASDRLIKGQQVSSTLPSSGVTPITGVSVGSGGNGTVSVGGIFTPAIDAFMDLIAWKEVSDGLGLSGYYENNGVGGNMGKFTDADIAAGGGFPASAGTRYNVGRYQFNRGDWTEAKRTYPQIKGYSPSEQDLVCYWKMGYRNCLVPLQNGDIRTAIFNGGKEWASLPGSPYGQVQAGYTVEQAIAYYQQRLAYYQGSTSSTGIPSSTAILATVASSTSSSTNVGILTLSSGADEKKGIGKGFEGVLNVDIIQAPTLLSAQPGTIIELAEDTGFGDSIRQSRRISEVKRSYAGNVVQCSFNIYLPVAIKVKAAQGNTASTVSSSTPITGGAPIPKKTATYMYMRILSGQKDDHGADAWRLSLIRDGKEVDSVPACSGSPSKHPIPRASDFAGSYAPLPCGAFTLDKVRTGGNAAGVGRYWIAINGTSPRSACGVHADINRSQGSPGSAGCVAVIEPEGQESQYSNTLKVVSWRNSGVATLVCNNGIQSDIDKYLKPGGWA